MNTTLELFWDLASLDQGKRLRAAADLVRALHTFQRAHRSGFADSDWDRLVDACAAAARKRRASAGARVEAEPEPDDGGDSVMEDADGGRERSERGATETDGGADCPSGAENVNPAGVSLKKVDFAQLDRLCAPDVSYALKRLLRGLPSSRDGARQGFALALTEVLAFLDFLDVSTVLDLIAQHTEVSSGLKGPEERDMLFGRLFGYTAVVQSGMLARPSTTLAQFQHLVTAAMGCARKKSFLMEGCYRVVGAALCTVTRQPYAEVAVDWLLPRVFEREIEEPEHLEIALRLRALFPNKNLSTYLPTWEHGDPLHRANLRRLSTVLRESGNPGVPGSGSWSAQLHGVWDVVFAAVMKHMEETKPSKKRKGNQANGVKEIASGHITLHDLWRTVVDDGLFSPTATPERKYWGFKLFEKLLPQLPESEAPRLFTPNFVKTLTSQLASHEMYLNKAAHHAIKTVLTVAETNKAAGLTLLMQLTGKTCTVSFDKQTNTKTIESLTAMLDVQGLNDYTDYLMALFLGTEAERDNSNDRGNVEATRAFAASGLLSMTRSKSLTKDEDLLQRVLRFFLVHGFFKVKTDTNVFPGPAPNPPLSEKTRTMCRERFLSLLGDLSSAIPPVNPNDGGQGEDKQGSQARPRKRSIEQGATADGEFWAYKALRTVLELESRPEELTLIKPLSEEAAVARSKVVKAVERMRKEIRKTSADGSGAEHRAFELMLSHAALQLMSEPDEATSLIEELLSCYKQTFPKKRNREDAKKRKRTKKKTKEDQADDDVEMSDGELEEQDEEKLNPVDVLMDVLLSFLSKPSAMLRAMAEQVFEILCPRMSPGGIQLMMDVLKAKDGVEGEAELFDEEELEDGSDDDLGDEDEDEVEDEDEDEDEDTPPKDAEKQSRGNSGNKRTADEALNQDLDKHLFAPNVRAAAKKETETEVESEEEELLGDEEMRKFDGKIAEVIRQMKLEKSRKRDAKQNIRDFKNRVLNLFDILIRRQSHNPILVNLAVPLVRYAILAAGNKDSKQLSGRASVLAKKLCKTHPAGVDPAEAWAALEEAHKLARKAPNVEAVSLLSAVSLFACKVLLRGSEQRKADEVVLTAVEERIASVYGESVDDFLGRKASKLHAAPVFSELASRYPRVAWAVLVPRLVGRVSAAATRDSAPAVRARGDVTHAYRLTQAFDAVRPLVSAKKDAADDRLFAQSVEGLRTAVVKTLECVPNRTVPGLNALRVREVLKVGLLALNRSRNVLDKEEFDRVWRASELRRAVEILTNENGFNSPALAQLAKEYMALFPESRTTDE